MPAQALENYRLSHRPTFGIAKVIIFFQIDECKGQIKELFP